MKKGQRLLRAWLIAVQGAAIPWLHRAEGFRWMKPIAQELLGRILEHNLRFVLRHGGVRDLQDIEDGFRERGEQDLADEFRDAVGDKAEYVLQRDHASWRENA